MNISCISYVHASLNLQVYALNDISHGLKTWEHVSNLNFFLSKMKVPPALESDLIPLVMLLTCEKFQNTNYVKKYNPEHRTKWEKQQVFYYSEMKAMFTCLFKGETSSRAELDYKIRLDIYQWGVSMLYIGFIHMIPWVITMVLSIPSI